MNRLDLATHGLYVDNFIGTPQFRGPGGHPLQPGLPAGEFDDHRLTFNFYETSVANPVGTVAIDGYSSNGTISLADATAAGSQLGSYDAIALGWAPTR